MYSSFLISWKINRDMNSKSFKVEYTTFTESKLNEETGKKENVESIVYSSLKSSKIKGIVKGFNKATIDVTTADKFNVGVFIVD